MLTLRNLAFPLSPLRSLKLTILYCSVSLFVGGVAVSVLRSRKVNCACVPRLLQDSC